ncbi:hypothetical protein DSCA_62530 [Desulfosarcina alkanivorans]|jgi:hypothetical protein|uniref:PA2779 family protein n=1 Tax=Desulfosarcina alkanivorans TaxID=571177 RepID=A0A5K7YWG5_9BACT|nr:PA2779 family protein [Desulfosarcina alkanivorans]BBO72323.1 hypothetical protein DSCA_62530 [Desulfosarcina alkanivorans]
MKPIRTTAKPVSWLMAILMMVIAAPCPTVFAAMVTAETILDADRVADARAYVDAVLSREEVTSALTAQGIDVREAMLRTRALSDAEILSLADRMEHLPAGGGAFETVLVVGLIVFLVLLFTDIAGATDIFPFVRK